MSGEDSKQLSVAELLARNAAQGAAPPSSGGGGRRRRSGRGLSVTDLTGENATVRSGPSSHAAPAPEPAAPEPAPTYAPEPTSYEPPASYQPAPYPPPGPAEPVFSPVSGPIARVDPNSRFSPDPRDPLGMGGSGSDPFGPYRAEARDSGTRTHGRGPDRLGAPGTGSQPVDPGIAELFGSGAIPAVPGSGGGRRRKPDPEDEPTPFPEPPPATGGRAARRRAAEAAEDAAEPWSPAPGYGPNGYDAFGPADAPQAFNGAGTTDPLSSFNGRGVDPGQGRVGGPAPDRAAGLNGFPGAEPAPSFGGFPGAEPAPSFGGFPGAEPAPGLNGIPGSAPGSGRNGFPGGEPAVGFNGYPGADRASGFNGFPAPAADATQAFHRAPGVDDPQVPGDQRPSLERRRSSGKPGGLPSWSARRHRPATKAPESGGFPTAAWSPVSQEQPLVAGQSVAGDLLRQQADQGADARTEVYRVGDKRGGEPDTDDYAESDYVDRDYVDNDYSDADYADGEYDDTDYDDYDYEPEPKPTRASRRAATKAAASKVARRAKSRAARGMAGSMAISRLRRGGDADADESTSRVSGSRALARVSRLTGGGSAESDNRRQWLILAGQSTGAAVAGMLLFKGFETLWETMHWVALALAMVVILGLVALVRVLRRTDDILSTVIAVVVGVFVTLGPLAFLLSTS
ncbi:hypothetical protein [Nocardia mangyaensis]|uniref:hypothetical protein n=1 Tax=Nocardia mangyaensis TaxID=2213200 RepID=UPI0026774E62|nr:hypothetical protein [Nocardia mangyaensis]MDO3650048.1 hypothetical protein [Nocardia mangyaensis]